MNVKKSTSICLFLWHLLSCNSPEFDLKSDVALRENFKKISTLYYQELSEQTFYSENDLREFAETHFSQNLKLGKTARIVSAETTSLTTNYSFEELFFDC